MYVYLSVGVHVEPSLLHLLPQCWSAGHSHSLETSLVPERREGVCPLAGRHQMDLHPSPAAQSHSTPCQVPGMHLVAGFQAIEVRVNV